MRTKIWLLALGATSCAVALIARAGLRINTSPSLPRGLYRTVDSPVARGSTVLACPPWAAARLARERGYLFSGPCPGGVDPLGKRVLAAGGDRVEVTVDGLRVADRLVPLSRVRRFDARGRPLPSLVGRTFVLAPGEVWLYAPHPRSFDSRIFGPIPRRAIREVVEPLWLLPSDLSANGAPPPSP